MSAVVRKEETLTREQRLARLSELSDRINKATEKAGMTYEELEKAAFEAQQKIRRERRDKGLYPYKSSI